jgi:hypothetical protein
MLIMAEFPGLVAPGAKGCIVGGFKVFIVASVDVISDKTSYIYTINKYLNRK